MTNEMLEEYTRLKIEEKTRGLEKEITSLKLLSKGYKTEMYFADHTRSTSYQGIDDITKELEGKHKELNTTIVSLKEASRELKESNRNYNALTDKYNNLLSLNIEYQSESVQVHEFKKDSLLGRLKKAFKGDLNE